MNKAKIKQVFPALIIIFVLIVDQVSKFLVKTSMFLGQEFVIIPDWFRIHFIENEGMAFGMQLGIPGGKLLLSLFRIIAVLAIGWYLVKTIRKNESFLKSSVLALILAGAAGNIIDSIFYGQLFTESTYYQVATFNPGNGYAPLLHGKVVDMLYFPIIDTTLPSWLPFFGGENFLFFRPVFNIADSSITIGVILLLIFHKKLF
ncbi:MAG: lipoprotein signal peptidase [Bacteroidales bacterium]|nr:lipoprotein signal peptidase [Bacteroidales bacterium]NPV35820.1 lipoprotein signal peptidase [Bacteroidales bacterium]